MSYLIQETFVDEDRNAQFGQSDVYEPYEAEDLGKLFRGLQKEYGACTSKVYITTTTEEAIPIGWVFQKRMAYDDARSDWPKAERTYIRAVWVSVFEECEHGDPRELTKTRRRESIATGLRYVRVDRKEWK